MQSNYDVIVVGGGGSGLAAAVSAADGHASVLLLEKESELGGSTGIAVGSITANRTRFQDRAGITDSLDDHAEDAGKFPPPEIEAQNNEDLRRWFLSHSADTVHWLMEMGIRFYGPSPEPPNRVPRMHNAVPGAKTYIAVLHSKLVRAGGTVITDALVTDLTMNNGRVTGVTAQIEGAPHHFEAAKGVVLAAGDYANSPGIISRFKGDRFAQIEGINPYSTGEGHLLAEKAGGQLVNMDVTYGPELRFIAPPGRTFQQLLPVKGPFTRLMGAFVPLMPGFIMNAMIRRLLVTWQHPENALFDDGALLVNKQGDRFCDETVWPDREIAIANQPDKICYILLDARLIERYSAWPHFISTSPKIAYAYTQDYLRLRPDVTVKAPTLEGIARLRGLDPARLKDAVSYSQTEKQAAGLQPLGEGPWMLLGPAKAYFTTTEGGAMINKQFQVLDANNQPIPGLYAVGQNGLGGQILWGHGLHICWAMTSGRLVGQFLASGEALEGGC